MHRWNHLNKSGLGVTTQTGISVYFLNRLIDPYGLIVISIIIMIDIYIYINDEL